MLPTDHSQTENPPSRNGGIEPSKRSRRAWLPGVAASVAAHLVLLFAFVSARPQVTIFSVPNPPSPVAVTLTRPAPTPPQARPDPPPGPAAPSQAAAEPAPATLAVVPPPPRPPARPRPAREPPPNVETLAAASAPPGPVPAPPPAGVTQAQLAGAATAGSGSGGGGRGAAGGGGGSGAGSGRCDMVRRVQDALRGNPAVVSAAARAHRALPSSQRALLVWDGDWVLNPGEEGRGLAGLRQVISVAVAFAPRECRVEPMRGLVLLTLADGAEGPRLALGQDRWRWSDLTGAR